MNVREVSGVIFGMTMGTVFLFGTALQFLAYGGMWVIPIIVETIFCYNPYFAVCYVWLKYMFTYNFWKI